MQAGKMMKEKRKGGGGGYALTRTGDPIIMSDVL